MSFSFLLDRKRFQCAYKCLQVFTAKFLQDSSYLIERDIDITELKLQYEEVQRVKWASKDEIKKMVQEGYFIDYWFTDLLFEMRKQRGAFQKI